MFRWICKTDRYQWDVRSLNGEHIYIINFNYTLDNLIGRNYMLQASQLSKFSKKINKLTIVLKKMVIDVHFCSGGV